MQINISAKAKEYRLELGISQKEVAEAIGLYLDEYVGLEDGSFNPSYFTVMDIANFYDVPVNYIFDRNRVIVQNIIKNMKKEATGTTET